MTRVVGRIGVIVCSLVVGVFGVSFGQVRSAGQNDVGDAAQPSPPISQAGAFVYVIPQSAHTPGDRGSNWRTDVILHNDGATDATAWIYFMRVDTDNSTAEGVKVSVKAHSSNKLADIVMTLFGQERSTGALLVGSDRELVVTSRTYNDDPSGTFGQFVQGYLAQTAIAAFEEVRLLGLAENAAQRTNLGFANVTDQTLEIRVTLFTADGTKLGEKTYRILPYSFTKKDKIINKEFGAVNVDDAFAVITSMTAGARYFTYASITDNLSNDPVCIVPVGRTRFPQLSPSDQAFSGSEGDGYAGMLLWPDLRNEAQPSGAIAGAVSSDQWEAMGPWRSVVVYALAIDPANPETVFAGTNAGVYKSTNGGGTWQGVGLLEYYIRSLAIDPINSHNVYALTLFSDRLFKSTDGGVSWLQLRDFYIALAFAIDPVNPQIIYLADFNGFHKSTDGGNTFAPANHVGLNINGISSIVIDPTDPKIIYAVGDPINKSLDRGESWTRMPIESGLSLVIDPTNPQKVFAGTWSSGIFRSSNGGSSWTASSLGLFQTNTFTLAAYNKFLAIDPTNPRVIYATTDSWGVFKSTSGGEEWKAVNSGLFDFNICSLALDPKNPQNLYVGTCGYGVFKSSNGGESWIAVNNGLRPTNSLTRVNALAIQPSQPPVVFAGTGGGSIFRTSGWDGWWYRVLDSSCYNDRCNTTAIAIDPATPQNIYAAISGLGLQKSVDGGVSWNLVYAYPNGNSVIVLAIDPLHPENIYAGTWGTGILKSSNRGLNWIAASSGLTSLYVRALAIDPTNPQTIYAGTWGGGVSKTTTGGASWSPVNAGLSDLSIKALAIDPVNSQIIYAGTEYWGVFKSENGGASWTQANSGLKSFEIWALAIDPENSKTIYAGTGAEGIFRSTDGGSSWSGVNTGLTNPFVRSLAIDPHNPTTVYAGTLSGVFKRTFVTCSYALDSSVASFPRFGGTGAIKVSTTADCAWAATSNSPWIIITNGASGSGNGSAKYFVSANLTGSPRSGVITIAGQTFTVNESVDCGPPSAPIISAPQTAKNNQIYELIWTSTSPINSYQVQESTNADFSNASIRAVTGPSTNVNHIAITPTTYYTRVRAIVFCDDQTYYSAWSEPAQTTVSSAGSAIYLPAAAHVTGLVGTNWRTDLEVHNPLATLASYTIALLEKDRKNLTPLTQTYVIGPNSSMRYTDALQELFSYSGSAALCIIPNEGSVMATGRTYNVLATGNTQGLPDGASFGQFIPGKPDTAAISYGQNGKLIGLSQSPDDSGGFRTNIGLASVVPFPIAVEIKLYRGDGTFIAGKSKILLPHGYSQLNMIFKDVIDGAMDDGYAEVITITPGGRFFAYASVIDNKSGDPIYIPAVVR